jgi:hypothetical protein
MDATAGLRRNSRRRGRSPWLSPADGRSSLTDEVSLPEGTGEGPFPSAYGGLAQILPANAIPPPWSPKAFEVAHCVTQEGFCPCLLPILYVL